MTNQERKYIEKTINRYESKQTSKLDELRHLNNKATLAANVFAYTFGSIGSLILGFGMSVAMQIILVDFMWLGIIIGLIGLTMCIVNYFIYKKIKENRKRKYAPEIIKISKALLNE